MKEQYLISLSPEEMDELLTQLTFARDLGSSDEGWQSDELIALTEKIRKQYEAQKP